MRCLLKLGAINIADHDQIINTLSVKRQVCQICGVALSTENVAIALNPISVPRHHVKVIIKI